MHIWQCQEQGTPDLRGFSQYDYNSKMKKSKESLAGKAKSERVRRVKGSGEKTRPWKIKEIIKFKV